MPFTTAYNAALKATNQEEFMALRKHMQRRRPRRPDSPITQAILIWAERQPITLEQATLVAKQFGVNVDEITHAREIVS